MPRVKVIKREKLTQDPQLVQMFNDMLNSENGDASIVAEKNTTIRSQINVISKILEDFSTGPVRKLGEEYQIWCDEFAKFGASVKKLLDLPEYKDIKDHNTTRQIILIPHELIQYNRHLNSDTLSDKFVLQHPGLKFSPFAFTSFDLKYLWNDVNIPVNARRYTLRAISILFQSALNVYRTTTSPDIDVGKFSKLIIDSIEKIKNHPELDRCRDAFNKIKESVALLETNFSDYYKDMVQSENPNTLIESFIIDVSKDQDMKPELLRQFRLILKFYQKQSAGKIKNPKVQAMFDNINQKMKDIGRQAKQAFQDSKDSDSSDSE